MGKWSEYQTSSSGRKASGGLYIRPKDGERIEFIVPSHSIPHRKFVKWVTGLDGKMKSVDESGPGPDIKERILVPVYGVAARDAQAIEMPPSAFAALAGVIDHPKVGGNNQVYEVSKSGAGTETRWSFQRIDRAEPAQLTQAEDVRWPDWTQWGWEPLGKKSGSHPEPLPSAPTSDAPADDDDIPF